jgi:hypothetical protein
MNHHETATAPRKKARRSYQRHGLTPLIRARYKPNVRPLDGRSGPVQAMAQYRAELLASLGGADTLSAQELTLVEMCAKDWLILQTVDAHILQAGLFSKRKRAAYPLTVQRMQIADSLARRLNMLGLKRRSRPAQTLAELLAAPRTESAQVQPSDAGQGQPTGEQVEPVLEASSASGEGPP